jgi:biopolymer transport protein ExbD
MAKGNRPKQEVNAGSMADIAFLLLIFFLVTTQIATDKGLQMRLPPKPDPNDPPPEIKFKERNIFKILVNSSDRILVENEPYNDISKLTEDVKRFVLNEGVDPDLSDSPEKAVVSIKTDRGTSYEVFIEVLDKVQGAYYEMRGERVGLSAEKFRNLDRSKEAEKELWNRGREGLPMQISIAEPSNIGG